MYDIIWGGNDTLLIDAAHVEGYLKDWYARRFLYKMNIDGTNFKKIFPEPGQIRGLNYRFISRKPSDNKEFVLSMSVYHPHRRVTQEIYLFNYETTERRRLHSVEAKWGRLSVDNKLRPRISTSYEKDETVTIKSYDLKAAKWKDLKPKESIHDFVVQGFANDNETIYYLARNKKSITSLYSAKLSESGTLSQEKEMIPNLKDDVDRILWDYDSNTPFFAEWGFGKPQRKFFSNSLGALQLMELEKVFPDVRIYPESITDNYILLATHSDTQPTSYYLFDKQQKTVKEILKYAQRG